VHHITLHYIISHAPLKIFAVDGPASTTAPSAPTCWVRAHSSGNQAPQPSRRLVLFGRQYPLDVTGPVTIRCVLRHHSCDCRVTQLCALKRRRFTTAHKCNTTLGCMRAQRQTGSVSLSDACHLRVAVCVMMLLGVAASTLVSK
jgi:hypothetical protein